MSSQYVYFTKLVLENVRSFAEAQVLDLTCEDGRPARWTLIVGDNGVGKTTLLQCLARMTPLYNEADSNDSESQPKAEPELMREERNSVLETLGRWGNTEPVRLTASLVVGRRLDGKGTGVSLETRVSITRTNRRDGRVVEGGSFVDTVEGGGDLVIDDDPFVLGYGAGRHMGHANSERISDTGATDTLFNVEAELGDAAEILLQLDDARLRKRPGSRARLDRLKQALTMVLPDVDDPTDIKVYGLPSPGLTDAPTGVRVRTPYGEVPFEQLSLGYQTVAAWTVDIASRLFKRYPASKNALTEPAIVIVDEIDLHLHPHWQRQLRNQLTTHFPNVQFIATAHSPVMAQSSLDANLAIVRREGDHAVIESDPSVVREWRLDQIGTELFDLKTPWPPDVEQLFVEQRELVAKVSRSAQEEQKLAEIKEKLLQLPTQLSPSDEQAMELVRRAAARLQDVAGNEK